MTEPIRPVLTVLKGGEPSGEELAALAAVLAARAAASSGEDEPQPLRQPLNAWVASGLVKGTRTKA